MPRPFYLRKADIKGIEKAKESGYTDNDIAKAIEVSEKLLVSAGLSPTVVSIEAEEDGLDVQMAIKSPFNIVITVDLSAKRRKIQELQARICDAIYTAHKKDIIGLLDAITFIITNKIRPMERINPDDENIEKNDAKEWLIYTITTDWNSLDIDIFSRNRFISQMTEALLNDGELPNDAGKVAPKDAQAAIEVAQSLSDKDWEDVVKEIKSSGGIAYVPTKKLIDKAVKELTSHEGNITMYDVVVVDDEVMVSIPTKYRYVYYVLQRTPGNKMNPVDGMLVVCDSTIHTGPDLNKMKKLITVAIDLDIGRDNTPRSEINRPKRPDKQKKDTVDSQLLENSLVFYYNADDNSITYKYKFGSGTISFDEYARLWFPDKETMKSRWFTMMQQGGVKDALLVQDGKVFLLDSATGKPVRDLGYLPEK